ncbi:MAG: lipoyl(octanoyl) transferase LipB [Pseudomonadota bacterium]
MRHLGTAPYEATRDAMAEFTRARTADTLDEVWLAEHPPVFTLGLNGSREHLLAPADIPVVATDRGGQVTYHGPGQVVLYPLLCLRRFGLGARSLVSLLEGCVIRVLADYAIEARADPSAPGVYVAPRRKIASIGLRIRRGCSYHGVALNVNGNLSPFTRINPCGYTGLEVTQMVDEGAPATLTVRAVGERLAAELCQRLTYNADAPISYVE